MKSVKGLVDAVLDPTVRDVLTVVVACRADVEVTFNVPLILRLFAIVRFPVEEFIESDEVPLKPPVVFHQYGKFPAVGADVVVTEPLPADVVVATILPVESVARMDEVTFAMIVELLKVAVELNVAPVLKVWSAVHVTLEAAVTKPGLLKLTVTEPVAFVFVVSTPPEVSAVTPVFVSVLPEKERLERVVVCTFPLASTLMMLPVTLPKTVELLKVAVELKVAPVLNVCNAVQVTLEAAVTNPGFTKLIAPVEVLKLIGETPENLRYSVEVV